MLPKNVFKPMLAFWAPETGGKNPEYKPNNEDKENPNDLTKPANREALYKKVDAKVTELMKKGDPESKKMAEDLKHRVTIARQNEKMLMVEPKQVADDLRKSLDAIVGKAPEFGLSITATPSPEAKAKAKQKSKEAKAEAADFGMIELVRAINATPGEGTEFSEAGVKKAKAPKVEVGPIVVTASPANKPKPPYQEIGLSLAETPMAVRNLAKRNDIPGTYYYQTSDGKRYMATVIKSGDGTRTGYKRIESA
jgi:hypothetical protein